MAAIATVASPFSEISPSDLKPYLLDGYAQEQEAGRTNILAKITSISMKTLATGDFLCWLYAEKERVHIVQISLASLMSLKRLIQKGEKAPIINYLKEQVFPKWHEIQMTLRYDTDHDALVGEYGMLCTKQLIINGKQVSRNVEGMDIIEPNIFKSILKTVVKQPKSDLFDLPGLCSDLLASPKKFGIKHDCVLIDFHQVLFSCSYAGTKYLGLSKSVCRFSSKDGKEIQMHLPRGMPRSLREERKGS